MEHEVFRATYGFVRGSVFEGQALVVAEPDPRVNSPGLNLKPSTGKPGETFYGIALIPQFSHFGHATKTSIIQDTAYIGRTVAQALPGILGDYVAGSESVHVDGVEVASEVYVLSNNDTVEISYRYPLTYTEYRGMGSDAFFAFDNTYITQVPCGREGRYRTQFYVAKTYKPDQQVRLARDGQFQPAKESSAKAIRNVRVIAVPNAGDPWLGIEVL